jgi:hypothetical protein
MECYNQAAIDHFRISQMLVSYFNDAKNENTAISGIDRSTAEHRSRQAKATAAA